MNKEIELTPGGGNFYRAMTFHWLSVAVFVVPVVSALILAVINPFWFRNSMFNSIESAVNRFTRWRNYVKYKIYLGTDPHTWHTLKGDL